MDWHRDTYFYDHLVGNAPSAVKIIYYPLLGRSPEPRLDIAVGSCLSGFTGEQQIDEQIRKMLPADTVMSSGDSCLLFDVHSFHSVRPDTDPLGSLRIIYSFVTADQFKDSYSGDPVHREIYEQYQRRKSTTW
jgi:hypothetical protein